MSSSFRIRTPEDQVAEEMRNRIRIGVWADKIPGILRLAKDLGTTRLVIERALQIMVDAGELEYRGAGRSFVPVPGAFGKPVKGSLILCDMALEGHAGQAFEVLQAVEAVLPGPVTWLSLDSFKPVEESLARLRQTKQETVVVMHHHGAIADALVQDGRRVIGLGTASVPKLCPSVAISYEFLVREALRRAFAAGHQRVTLPLWRRKPEVIERVRGYVSAEFAAAGLRHSPAMDCPVLEDHSPEALHRLVRELFRFTPPTALVVHDLPEWLAVQTALASMRKVVPDDVSVLVLAHSREFDYVTPSLAHFSFPVEAYAHEVRNILRKPASHLAGQLVGLLPTWIQGNSLGAPARRR